MVRTKIKPALMTNFLERFNKQCLIDLIFSEEDTTDEEYFPPTTAFDSDDDYEPEDTPSKKKAAGGAAKATKKGHATPSPSPQKASSAKVQFFNSRPPPKDPRRPNVAFGQTPVEVKKPKPKKKDAPKDSKKTRDAIRAAVKESLQAAAASITVKQEQPDGTPLMSPEDATRMALHSLGTKGKGAKKKTKSAKTLFPRQSLAQPPAIESVMSLQQQQQPPIVKPEMVDSEDPGDLLEKVLIAVTIQAFF